jgi:AraC-like DNA-binding protein
MFDAPLAAMAVDRPTLDLPLSEHNQELFDLATRYMELEFPKRQPPFLVQVRKVVERLLGTGACSYTEVATALAMHPRTLQRRLHDAGTTFEAIKDEVRRDLAERYLAHPDVPLTQVTALLDYSEQSALTRSCRRWFHATPRSVRANLSSGTVAMALA